MLCDNNYICGVVRDIMAYEATRRVETSARTFTIIEHLDQTGPAGVSAIAAELEMSKGIVHNHLSTLRELGYVTQVDDQYELSLQLFALGQRVRAQSPLYQQVERLLESYAERVDAGVIFAQQSGDQMTIVDTYRLSSPDEFTTGTALPLYDSLLGVVSAVGTDKPRQLATDHSYDESQITAELEDNGVVAGTITPRTTTLCLAFPVTDGTYRGSVGIVVPPETDSPNRLTESASTLRSRLDSALQQDNRERSFTTEKHSWIGG